MILQSKVDCYCIRKKYNDNYDLYLKTIVNSWIKSVYTDATENERKALDAWKLSFDKKPQHAATKTTEIFKIRKEEDVDYLSALMIKGHEIKNKINVNK